VAIRTLLTDRFGLDYPIVLAPMGTASTGELAAAVSNAGGLGLVGGGYGDLASLRQELESVKQRTARPWGVGVITWSATREAVTEALAREPHAFFLSFGDPSEYIRMAKARDCSVFCQVQSVRDGIAAKQAGADVIVAQGAEAGGHGATRGTLGLVPALVDAVAPLPVVAAGGIADGRGLAAALALGAAGAVIGTRFCATREARVDPGAQARLVRGSGDDTVRTRIFDIARGYDWPAGFTGRALRNRFVEDWHGREADLARDRAAVGAYREAAARGDFETALVWAGEAVDLIDGVAAAGDVVREIGEGAEQVLRRLSEIQGWKP